jgi:hypothetical protein
MPLGEFQEDMRLCEGVSLIHRHRHRAVRLFYEQERTGSVGTSCRLIPLQPTAALAFTLGKSDELVRG